MGDGNRGRAMVGPVLALAPTSVAVAEVTRIDTLVGEADADSFAAKRLRSPGRGWSSAGAAKCGYSNARATARGPTVRPSFASTTPRASATGTPSTSTCRPTGNTPSPLSATLKTHGTSSRKVRSTSSSGPRRLVGWPSMPYASTHQRCWPGSATAPRCSWSMAPPRSSSPAAPRPPTAPAGLPASCAERVSRTLRRSSIRASTIRKTASAGRSHSMTTPWLRRQRSTPTAAAPTFGSEPPRSSPPTSRSVIAGGTTVT